MTFPYQAIDLSHTLDETIPSWSGGCGFRSEIKSDYSDFPDEIGFRVQQIKMHAGIGTHLDAPAHCIPGAASVDRLSFDDLIAPCIVIDVSDRAHERYRLSVEDILAFEKRYGTIEPGQAIMIRTGWERFWSRPEKYRNEMLFPSVSGEAAGYLLDTGAVGIGIDTLSPDKPEDGFPVHSLFLGAGKYILENVAGLANLPACGSYLLALPLKMRDCTEAPVRLVAFIRTNAGRI